MATDHAKLAENLRRFYDFAGKEVLFVGAGGGQLLDPSAGTKKLIAVDKDINALRQLKARVAEKGLESSVEVLGARFEEVNLRADTIYFEFCLHEMEDPEQALTHAKFLAPDIVVFDHSPGSEWSYYAAEEEKVSRSAAAMGRFGIRKRQSFQAEQRFRSYAELLAKVTPQGTVAIERAQRFAGAADLVIPMRYELNLL